MARRGACVQVFKPEERAEPWAEPRPKQTTARARGRRAPGGWWCRQTPWRCEPRPGAGLLPCGHTRGNDPTVRRSFWPAQTRHRRKKPTPLGRRWPCKPQTKNLPLVPPSPTGLWPARRPCTAWPWRPTEPGFGGGGEGKSPGDSNHRGLKNSFPNVRECQLCGQVNPHAPTPSTHPCPAPPGRSFHPQAG